MGEILPALPDVKGKDGKEIVAWLMRSLTLAAIACGAWFASETWGSIKSEAADIKADVRGVHTDLTKINMDLMAIQASKFTAMDWVKAKDLIDTKFADHDRRLQRVEDGLTTIKESLKRIEDNLGTKGE